jgi:hypothetical protein
MLEVHYICKSNEVNDTLLFKMYFQNDPENINKFQINDSKLLSA